MHNYLMEYVPHINLYYIHLYIYSEYIEINTQPIGHHWGKSGVSHYNKWMTSGSYDNFGRKWVVSMSSPEYYYGNTIQFATNPWASGAFTVASNFGINVGPYAASQLSTFACAEVIHLYFLNK